MMRNLKCLFFAALLLVIGTCAFGGAKGHTSDCVMLAPGEGHNNPWTVTTVCGSQSEPVSFTSNLGTGYSVHMAAADVGFG
jgi:hypothetical protein